MVLINVVVSDDVGAMDIGTLMSNMMRLVLITC